VLVAVCRCRWWQCVDAVVAVLPVLIALGRHQDYLDSGSMADSADLVVLGGYYGTGNKGGLISTLLLGVKDTSKQRWCTVVKCGNGMSDDEINNNQSGWHKVGTLRMPAPVLIALAGTR
jgi:hypothetical protein